MDEYEIHPTRRGSNIDHDVLASGSIEALKLEELFRATHQTEDHGPISPVSIYKSVLGWFVSPVSLRMQDCHSVSILLVV